MTATPWRGDGFEIETLLGQPLVQYGIAEGLQKHFLCEVDYHLLADNLNWELVQERSSHNYSLSQLNRKLIIPVRDEEAARQIVDVFRTEKLRKEAAGNLPRDLAALPGLPVDALKECWQALHGSPPPARLGRTLLMRGIAYRMQEQALGGLGPATRRRLARAAEEIGAGRTPSPTPTAIKPGTRLLREWQGVVHEAIVLENGVQYCGETWKSLSAVAREITGTHWSGPLFFGLKKRRHDGR